MIISLEEAKVLVEFKGWTDEKISRKLKAVEATIRQYTNNNFQVRSVRGVCTADGSQLIGNVPGLNVGDTIQITQSKFNDILCATISIDDDIISIDAELTPEESVLVTLVKYPDDVVECCLDLLEWSVKRSDKVGIKSETLSRHSVTYESLFNGYPVGILNGLNLYKKARF